MIKGILAHLPGRSFLLTNTLVWLGLNTIASYVTHHRNLHYGKTSEYLTVWLEFFPWWGHWIWLTPLIVSWIAAMPYRRHQLWQQVRFNLTMFVVLMLLYWVCTIFTVSLLIPDGFSAQNLSKTINGFLRSPYYLDVVVYASVVCVGYVRSIDARMVKEERRNRELAHQLVQTELDSLKAQLNPHFLFNTLNSIAGLIRQDDKGTALTAMSQLSLMLRKVLEHQSSQMITLGQELEFTESFLTIQKLRFAEKLRIEIDVSEDCLSLEVPFMLLQPFIENAAKHSALLETDDNLLLLKISCNEEYLFIVLINKFSKSNDNRGFGIGIDNSEKRLKRLYQDDFQLELAPVGDGYFETRLTIPAGGHDDQSIVGGR